MYFEGESNGIQCNGYQVNTNVPSWTKSGRMKFAGETKVSWNAARRCGDLRFLRGLAGITCKFHSNPWAQKFASKMRSHKNLAVGWTGLVRGRPNFCESRISIQIGCKPKNIFLTLHNKPTTHYYPWAQFSIQIGCSPTQILQSPHKPTTHCYTWAQRSSQIGCDPRKIRRLPAKPTTHCYP